MRVNHLNTKKNNKYKKTLEHFYSIADVQFNGSRPWDIKVLNENFYQRHIADGSLGLGESYMDGWWDCDRLDQFCTKILRAGLNNKINLKSIKLILNILSSKIFNLQSKARAFEVAEKHYDLGNDLYSLMLDKYMMYTCGYWKNAKNLEEAQEAKLDLICKKLHLKSGERVLDTGCGWGGFARFAAQNYGVSVIGVTVSKEQVKLGNELCKGLPIEIRLQDYRDLNEKFDHIASIGIMEHVGFKNHNTYFKMIDRCLKDDGLLLVHTITSINNVPSDPWATKYIFPNGEAPSFAQLAKVAQGRLVIEDWHNFGADYDPTLMAWYENFNNSWHKISDKYGERFYRMWKYYLLMAAGLFRSRHAQLTQVLYSKNGIMGGYQSIR